MISIFVDRYYTVSYYNHVNNHTTEQERDDFKKYLNREFNIDFIIIFNKSQHLEYKIKCNSFEDVKDFLKNKSKIDGEIQLFFEGIGHSQNQSYEELIIDEMPNELIEFDKIYLECKNINNLHNIHKYLKCGHLQLDNILEVKSNILGLMLLPDTTFIDFTSIVRDTRDKALLEILQKYSGKRDILEFQEELIINGFKELAKI